MLFYCYANFYFDRETFQLTVDVLPPGSFERQARVGTDPSEIALFLACFDSLRFLTVGNLCLRLSMNLSFYNRFRCVVDAMLLSPKRANQVMVAALNSNAEPSTDSSTLQQRRVSESVATVFVVLTIVVLVVSEKAMAASYSVCGGYPQCVAYAHRLDSSGSTCPCLTLIEKDRSPRTYDEWMRPVDVTDSVKQLSASGDLLVLQLINRAMPRWPEELRRCRGLSYLYANTCEVYPNDVH